MLGVKPSCKLLKGEYGVDNAFVVVGFVLFRNAGTDEHGFGVRESLLYIAAVCLHRREYVREILQFFREIFLYKEVYRMTARGYHDIAVFLMKHTFVFRFDHCGAYSGFFHTGKPQLT